MKIINKFNFSEKNLENKSKKLNLSKEKELYSKIDSIILTTSDGHDLLFLQYTTLGVGDLILTYIYALYIKLFTKDLKIIPFYPILIHPIIKNFKYFFVRSSFQFNYKKKHLKRLFHFFLLRKPIKNIFIRKKDLFLSTDIINQDSLFFKKISDLDLNYIKANIISVFNFNYTIKEKADLDLIKSKDRILSVGLHLRRGDFKTNRNSSSNFNTSPDINSQIDIIKKIKAKIKVINVYSDQSHSKTIEELNGKLNEFKLNLFPENANGTKVLQDMTKNDVIILSNSTLSVVSCILSNQLALFNNQILPKQIKKYFKNIHEIN